MLSTFSTGLSTPFILNNKAKKRNNYQYIPQVTNEVFLCAYSGKRFPEYDYAFSRRFYSYNENCCSDNFVFCHIGGEIGKTNMLSFHIAHPEISKNMPQQHSRMS